MNLSMDAELRRHRQFTFVVLSILAHILLVIGLTQTSLVHEIKIPENTVYVDLNAQPDAQQLVQDEKEQARQVVESEMAADSAKPKDAKYLGERDQLVEEETKAKQVDSFRKGGAASAAGSGAKPTLALKSLAPAAKAFTPPTKAEIDGYKERQKEVAKREASAGGAQSADSPGSASNDYLKDVKEGNRTLLSTKEFVYFSYYRRIREKLEVAWNSRLRSTLGDQVYSSGRQLASDQNYVTGLVIVLDRFGKITAIQVMQKSGARALDQAAIDAFNSAGPFPDPPSGLIDQNGQIKIRWDFILQS